MYLQEKVNKYYPETSIYEAMEIWSLPQHKKHLIEEVCNKETYFAQVKKDGNWYEYSKSKLGVAYLFSRGLSTKTGLPVENIANVPHIKEIFDVLPNDTVIIGEIYYPNETSNEVRSIMGCLPLKAIQRQKVKGFIHFYIYDILRFDGIDLTNLGALDRYNKLIEVVNQYNLLQNDWIEIADIITDNIYNFIIESLDKGEEGVVLKLKEGHYSEGKRPAWQTIKWKKQDDVDVICMGFEDATMEYTGTELETWSYWAVLFNRDYPEAEDWIIKDKIITLEPPIIKDIRYKIIPITKPYFYNWKTSIRIGAYKDGILNQIGTVSSGLTDELRKEFSENSQKYIGHVLTCNCMEITKDSLRHPIFKGFREDKDPKKCRWEDIFK